MTTTSISRLAKGLTLRLEQIEIPATARPYNATAVLDLSKSIATIGLQSAPTVVDRDGHFVLVAGRHRIEALKLLGIESVLVRSSTSTTSRRECGPSARTFTGRN